MRRTALAIALLCSAISANAQGFRDTIRSSSSVRRSALAISFVLALLLPIAASAQFRETISVKLIELDVVVTDRDGHRVHGLAAGDFDIREAGTKQTITNFAEYAAPETSATIAANSERPQPAVTRPPQRLLVFIESLPRPSFVRQRALEQLEALTTKILREGDTTSIVYWNASNERPQTVIEPTKDRVAVANAVHGLIDVEVGSSAASLAGQAEATNVLVERATASQRASGANIDSEAERRSTEFFAGESALSKFERKVAAMTRLIESLASERQKRTFLYVTNDFAMLASGTARQRVVKLIDDLVRTANALGVTIYAVAPDVRDESGMVEVRAREIEALQRLTLATGGKYEFGLVSVESVGKTLIEDVSSYYSLAYEAKSDGSDRERRVVVSVRNRPELQVRARQSVVEKSKTTAAHDILRNALLANEERDDLPFGVALGRQERTSSNRRTVAVMVGIPSDHLQFEPEGNERVAYVKVMFVSANGISEITPVTEEELRVVAGKNDRNGVVTYRASILANQRGSVVSIGVLDQRTGIVGVRTLDLRAAK